LALSDGKFRLSERDIPTQRLRDPAIDVLQVGIDRAWVELPPSFSGDALEEGGVRLGAKADGVDTPPAIPVLQVLIPVWAALLLTVRQEDGRFGAGVGVGRELVEAGL
jgi:hypothetical protein